jgi:hypothetical protein
MISTKIKQKLETFQHKAICFTLNINMHQVKEGRKNKNEKVRELFGGINMVSNFATRRRLDFIRQILRQENRKLTKKLLTCWIQRARASGGQQSTLKDATSMR